MSRMSLDPHGPLSAVRSVYPPVTSSPWVSKSFPSRRKRTEFSLWRESQLCRRGMRIWAKNSEGRRESDLSLSPFSGEGEQRHFLPLPGSLISTFGWGSWLGLESVHVAYCPRLRCNNCNKIEVSYPWVFPQPEFYNLLIYSTNIHWTPGTWKGPKGEQAAT